MCALRSTQGQLQECTVPAHRPSLALALPEQVENLAYCPDVLIADSYFSRIPTRGILMTSRGEANQDPRAGAGPGRAARDPGPGARGLLQAARAAV